MVYFVMYTSEVENFKYHEAGKTVLKLPQNEWIK
jgi:hypothetical protein